MCALLIQTTRHKSLAARATQPGTMAAESIATPEDFVPYLERTLDLMEQGKALDQQARICRDCIYLAHLSNYGNKHGR